ncbi:MAG: hypothetical protein VB050_04070 [Geobacteraceae bacterium]|nr:hypothetical protein [Geobacteraceae bacterium]
MKFAPWSRYFVAGLVLIFLAVDSDVSLAIDPKFDIDLKQLRPGERETQSADRKGIKGIKAPASAGADASAPSKRNKPAAPPAVAERKPGRNVTGSSARETAKRRSGRKVKKAGLNIRKKRRSRHARHNRPSDICLSGARTLNLFFRLPAAGGAERGETLLQARNLWDRIVPAEPEKDDKLALRDRSFSLTLDPAVYPVFRDIDGGRIIVDPDGALSLQVKAIIVENDPTVHFVEADPSDPKRFYTALLGSARFYSVEEGFEISFGSDPMVTVKSDFKVEKTADSLLNHDVVLLNVSDHLPGMPPALCSMLDREGFKVIDVLPVAFARPMARSNRLYSVKGSDQHSAVDSLLTAASVRFEKDREIKLDDGSHSGVALSARADRFFREGGEKVVVSFSKTDPIQHALMQILQQNGYHVVNILPEDSFRSIAEKLAPVLKQSARYGSHYLRNSQDAPFAVRMSGVEMSAGGRNGGAVFVTDVGIDPLTSDLLGFMGYDVLGR